jgi:hypothetical protein
MAAPLKAGAAKISLRRPSEQLRGAKRRNALAKACSRRVRAGFALSALGGRVHAGGGAVARRQYASYDGSECLEGFVRPLIILSLRRVRYGSAQSVINASDFNNHFRCIHTQKVAR